MNDSMRLFFPLDVDWKIIRDKHSMRLETDLNDLVIVVRPLEGNIESFKVALMIAQCFERTVEPECNCTAGLTSLIGIKYGIMNRDGVTLFLDSVIYRRCWNRFAGILCRIDFDIVRLV